MFSKVMIANRGEIAVRVERTLKKMGIRSVAVYARADQDSLHVDRADETVCLGEGTVKETYLDAEKILQAAIDTGAEAVHPGYGFLSENTDFAEACARHGIKFIGPTSEQILEFGLKHRARAIAQAAGVPLSPGSGLLNSAEEAVAAAEQIGYPVMLKSTAGGGGIGMRIVRSSEELRRVYDEVRHLAAANFNDADVFVEKYVERARHVEVQIFGNEYGEAVALSERDCSVQRRNQKVVEECPAPNVPEEIRTAMESAAESLAKQVGYRNAGTVEFLYDEAAGKFYFLEVNTRLQVEHRITEDVLGIDLVEWMVREAAGELRGLKGRIGKPDGYAIECRIYAEDCRNGFLPGTGKVDDAVFAPEAEVETWLRKGVEVTSLYDPMLAKLIVHGSDRKDAVEKMHRVLSETRIYGVTNNLQYLRAFFETEEYRNGMLHTGILNGFQPEEYALEVLDGGVQTTVQDYPGMIGYWAVGVPPCGPFDDYSFRIGNVLLGNEEGAPGLEMTLRGGRYRFRTSAAFCLTGADMHAKLDGEPVPRYTVLHAAPNQVLSLESCEVGMRAYLLVAGGLDIPKIMGSASTFADGKFGGHNGRALRTGDVLNLQSSCAEAENRALAEKFQPALSNEWTIGVLPGPQPTPEYLKEEYLDTLTSTEYEVNFNSARTGVRLNGPIPQWVREDGGEAGLHPSNIHDNPYAVGTMDLTGDQSILLGPDGPSLGGFVCSVTTAKGELWKLGQLHPGDKVHFQLLDLEQAGAIRGLQRKTLSGDPQVISMPEKKDLDWHYAILADEAADGVRMVVRLDGEDNLLVEYGEMKLDIALRFRVHVLMQELEKKKLPVIDLTPGIRSLQIHFDLEKTNAAEMVRAVTETNRSLPKLQDVTVPSRKIRLPLSWDDPQTQLAARRYQQTTRPNAPWCPSNPEFIRRINGLDSLKDVQDIVFQADYLVLGLGDVYLGAPVATPVDPRQRLVTTKYNPARPWTPENAVGIGGAYLCVYGMEGPGGYQFVGRTIQMWNPLRETKYFVKGKPWLLNFFDQIQFYPVSAEEILQDRNDFLRGKFDIEVEETTFSLKDYEAFLKKNADTIHAFKTHQEAAFEAERQMWKEKGLDHFDSEEEDTPTFVEETVPDGCVAVRAGIPGSVWKIEAEVGDTIEAGQKLVTLESMKMEFPVAAEEGGNLREIYIEPGDKILAGQIVAAVETPAEGSERRICND